jgi:IclR family transcriptional regulator, pca regulon regulatory protein
MTESQLDAGLRGVAVALRDRKGECMGAVGMTMPAAAYTPEQIRLKLLPLLDEAPQALRPLL